MAGPGLHQVQRMSLQQILAPQLQQSLHLLQVPTLELRSLVQEELQQNPLLEEIPKDEPTTEIESPEGEVVVGPAPFLGYAGGALCGGPWRTGDLGRMDAGGFLFVDGRRDSLIITAFGRNISPEWVESELLAQPQIRQAIVFDDGAHGLAALIVPLVADLDDIAIGAAVDRANLRLPAYAQVARWHGRGPLEPALGEVTGNGRPRRAAVIAIHRLVAAAE